MTTLAPPDMAAIARYIELFTNDIGPTGEMAEQLRRLVAVCERQQKLLIRASRQLSRWAETYGANGPQWLPPAGDVELQEDIDQALALTREEV